MKVYNHGFKHNGKWLIENCPTTIGLPCPICEANGDLWNTGIKENQDIVRNRKRKIKYISNILVLSDSKRTQNEGKIFLFSYGTKIFKKLMNAIEPEFEDEKSFNPFDFWDGAPFKLKIRNEEGYRNYDKSEFGDCGSLFESDEAMEEVWKNEYPLLDFIAPKQFKSYDDLKTKFFSIVNSKTQSENQERPTNTEIDRTVERPSRAVATKVENDDDDDDMVLFQSLIDD